MGSRRTTVILFILALVCVAAYSNTLDVPFQFDDSVFLDSPRDRDVTNVPSMFAGLEQPWASRPLMHATLALNYYLGGMDTTGYHLLNLALHIINGLLLYLLIVLTGRHMARGEGEAEAAAVLASAIFMLHPAQTEAVTYIISRSMLMATTFCFLGLILFLKAATGKRRRGLYMAGLFVASVMGVASRENFVVFPVVLFLYDMFFISGFRLREALSRYRAYLPVVPALGYFAFLALNNTYDTRAANPGVGYSAAEYVAGTLKAHLTYLRLLVLPVNQNIDYDYPVAGTLRTIGAVVFYAAFLALAARLARKRSVASFGMLWFAVLLFPVSFAVALMDLKLDDVIFEHRLYLPGAGLVAAAAAGLVGAREKLRPGWRKFLTAVVVAVLVVFSAATYARNGAWTSEVGLWSDALSKSPGKVRPHYNLGYSYFMAGMPREAIVHLSRAAGMAPDEPDIHDNLGVSYDYLGMTDKAVEEYLIALELDPDQAPVHNNLGIAYRELGRTDEAIEHFTWALELSPDMAEAHFHLGEALRAKGKTGEAMPHLRAAIRLDPADPDAHIELGAAFGSQGRLDEAIEQFEEAVRLAPDNAYAHFNLGVAYTGKGMLDDAEEQLNTALRLAPGNEDALMWLETVRRQRVQ